jgi:hypothetical protein
MPIHEYAYTCVCIRVNVSVSEWSCVVNICIFMYMHAPPVSHNPKQTKKLFKYVMDMCKYDLDYDLRDKARLYRALFFKPKVCVHVYL